MFPWLDETQQHIQSSIRENKLHHAHIVSGKQGVGKAQLVLSIATSLLCMDNAAGQDACGKCKSCLLMASGSHPDWYEVNPENQIGVDDIRLVTNKLNGSSGLMQAKILHINHAHKMTVAAANSLLKTLEEPTAYTYLFLTTHKASALLPTIVSRCRKLPIAVNSIESSREWLKQQGLETSEDLLQLYWQSPLFLAQLLQDQDNILHSLSRDLTAVHTGMLLSDTFTARYQDHVESCLDWLQFALHRAARGTDKNAETGTSEPQQDELWLCQNELNACKQQANQPGINKTLILSRALACLPQNLSF